MTRALIYFALIALLAAGAVWLADNPGEVVINWQGYIIELSVVWLATCTLLLVVVTSALTRLWRWFRKGFREQRKLSRYQRSFDELGWGLGALMANDGAKARRHADAFSRLSDNRALSNIISGQAALLQEDLGSAKAHFAQLEEDPRTRPIALRGLLTIADQEGDAEAAYDVAEKAQSSAPKAAWAQRPFLEAAVELGRWDGAAQALRAAMAQGHLGEEEGARLQAAVALSRALEVPSENSEKVGRYVREALKFNPGLVPASVLAAKLAHEKRRYRRAQRVLRDGWKHTPHPDLAAAFIDLRASDSAAQQYKRVCQLVGGQYVHPEGLYAQAKFALAAGLLGKARHHLDAMRELLPQKRVYQMLSDVEAQAGNAQAQHKNREKMAGALPDPAWHCDSCGQEHVSWQPVCSDCGSFATVEWTVIDRKVPALPKNETEEETTLLIGEPKDDKVSPSS